MFRAGGGGRGARWPPRCGGDVKEACLSHTAVVVDVPCEMPVAENVIALEEEFLAALNPNLKKILVVAVLGAVLFVGSFVASDRINARNIFCGPEKIGRAS